MVQALFTDIQIMTQKRPSESLVICSMIPDGRGATLLMFCLQSLRSPWRNPTLPKSLFPIRSILQNFIHPDLLEPVQTIISFDKTLRYVQFKINSFGENIDDSKQTPTPPPVNALELLMSKPKVDKQP